MTTHLRAALDILKKLTHNGYTAYFAGGCVRDLVMKRTPKDYDIATTASPEEIERLFPKCVPVGKQFGVILVVAGPRRFEVSTFRKEGPYKDGRHPEGVSFTTPEEDAKRRDFTVNGLFHDPVKHQTIDYVGGREDIQAGIIRTIGRAGDRFEEDKLRILRAIRFGANLGFDIEKETWEAIKAFRKKIHVVSAERIRDELVKMFTRPNAGHALELLSQSGLLKELLPEIESMKGVEQPPEFHPEGDVFVHTKMLMERLKNAEPVLVWGALLHDVGKPQTFSVDGKRIRFNNHAHLGAQMAKAILQRLRFSNREVDRIVSCVENHMKFANVKEMRIGKLKQFMARDNFPIELKLHRIDCLSSHGSLELYRFLKLKQKEFKREDLKPKPLLNGYDLIRIGFEPGPIMKEILDQAYSFQLENRHWSKKEALDWVKHHFVKKSTDT